MSRSASRTDETIFSERYRALLEVGRTVSGTLNPEELYRVIHRETTRIVEADGFYISTYDPASDRATVVFYADRGDHHQGGDRYVGSESDVIRTGEAQLFSDRSEVGQLLVLGDDAPRMTRSAISAPLRYKGRVLGAVGAQSYRRDAYVPEDLELLQGIADIAAVAVDNVRRMEELQRRRREAERIEEIGRALSSSLDRQEVLGKVVDAARDLVGAGSATVWLLNGDAAEAEMSGGSPGVPEGLEWPLRDSVRELLCRSRQPLVIEDLSTEAVLPEGVADHLGSGSMSAVPLVVSDEVRGVLMAVRPEASAFGEADLTTMERLASQASVALENARLHSRVQQLSLTDPLTGLPNRRHLTVHLEREIAAARRGRSLAVVIYDLDDFKRCNDTLGHVAGDEILRRVGQILIHETRAMNLAARYGGDEFVTVVSDTDRSGVLAHACRIVDRVEEHPDLRRHGIRVSYGIGHFSEEMDGPQELIQAADRALYRVKNARRDREGRAAGAGD